MSDADQPPVSQVPSGSPEGRKAPDVLQPPSTNAADAGASRVDRAMRKMAERAPETLVEMTAMMGPMMGHPLHQKMNEGHITRMLDLAVQHDTNEHSLRKDQQQLDFKQGNYDRLLHAVYFVCFLAVVVLVLCLFHGQPNVLVPILAGVGGTVTGFIGGMGYARSTGSSGKRKDD